MALLNATGTVRNRLAINSIAFSPDGGWIVAVCNVSSVRVWDAVTGKELLVLTGHERAIVSAGFNADKTRIVTASADKTVRVWDAQSGELLGVYLGHNAPLISARFLPGGNVMSVDDKGSARVWPAEPLPTARTRAPRELTVDERKQYEVPPPLP